MWEDFAPPRRGCSSGLVGGKARHARPWTTPGRPISTPLPSTGGARTGASAQLRSAREAHDQTVKALEAEVREHNAAVDELERDFRAGVPEAVEEYFTELLALSQYPGRLPAPATRSPTGKNPAN